MLVVQGYSQQNPGEETWALLWRLGLVPFLSLWSHRLYTVKARRRMDQKASLPHRHADLVP